MDELFSICVTDDKGSNAAFVGAKTVTCWFVTTGANPDTCTNVANLLNRGSDSNTPSQLAARATPESPATSPSVASVVLNKLVMMIRSRAMCGSRTMRGWGGAGPMVVGHGMDSGRGFVRSGFGR